MSAAPLRRNRDFMLLQTGQLLSGIGTQSTSTAYPLLVLDVTQSPAKTGIVSFVRILPAAVLALPTGVAADHWNRKRLMVVADAVRVPRSAPSPWRSSPPTSRSGRSWWSRSSREPARRCSLPPRPARCGPSSRCASSRPPRRPRPVDGRPCKPFQEEREPDRSTIRARLLEGIRFVWGRPFLRTCASLFGLTNFIGPGVLLAVVVIGTAHRLSGAGVGVLIAAFGACLLLGSVSEPATIALFAATGLVLALWGR